MLIQTPHQRRIETKLTIGDTATDNILTLTTKQLTEILENDQLIEALYSLLSQRQRTVLEIQRIDGEIQKTIAEH